MTTLSSIASKFLRVRDFPRYARELPAYLRGNANATTQWGERMRVPFPEFRSICERGYIDGNEVPVYEYFKGRIKPTDVFFDIGANAGFYSVLANHLGAKVYAFEINPRTFALLAANARGNITAHHIGVSDSNAGALVKVGMQPGLTSLSPEGTIPVKTISLDEFGIVPTVMKVDVEGHEIPVFRGAEKMLRAHMPDIVVEGSPDITAYLISLGYELHPLGDSGNDLFKKSNA